MLTNTEKARRDQYDKHRGNSENDGRTPNPKR